MADSPDLISLARSAAQEAGVPEDLLLGLVKTESAWNPNARSRVGALGLTQVMPIWTSPTYAASIGMVGMTVADLMDPLTNLTAGARILAQELIRFGKPELAAMAYNAGAGVVKKAINEAGTDDPSVVSGYLPAAETRAYWQKVKNWANYYATNASELLTAAENTATDTAENIKQGSASTLFIVGLFVLGILFLAGRR